jgi:DNA-binding response OmpR family regulator
MLDDSIETFASPRVDDPDRWPASKFAGAHRTASCLVLFLGKGCRPGPSERETLSRVGMRCIWLHGTEQALNAARGTRFDAAVLDSSLIEADPELSFPRLRSALACPIVSVAAHRGGRDGDLDEILALELGADAYLEGPVTPRLLRAHLLALLRRTSRAQASAPRVAPVGDAAASGANWELDRTFNRLRGRSSSVLLTDVQCAYLQCLLEANGRVVARQRLAASMPKGQLVHARSVDVYVHRLRKKLKEVGVIDLDIETVRGRGYLLKTGE